HIDIVRLLIDNGAELNAEGTKYGSALQAAIGRDHEEVAALLIEKGASAAV
ncbi:hypothetical protein DFH06DRAFT_1005767, partial [Mycena polygramma]